MSSKSVNKKHSANQQGQALALARRMAGRKKGEATQLQIDVCTEEEWQKLLAREGLMVVDVYSGWCGPCVGMLGNLKKLKLEIGGDILQLATAKADNIQALERFRNKSEPTWMFIGSGHLVNLMFGANAPRLSRMLLDELAKETEALKGNRQRQVIPFHELTSEEKERKAEEERRRQEALAAEEEATAAKLNALRLMSLARRDVEPLHLVLLPPHVVVTGPEMGAWLEVSQALTTAHALVLEEHQVELQPETASAALVLGDEGSEARREWCIALQTGPCVAMLIGIDSQSDEESASLADALHEQLGSPDPSQAMETAPDSISARYRDGFHVPGVWAPSEPEKRISAVALLFPELGSPPEMTGDGGDAPVEVSVGVFASERQRDVLEALQPIADRMLAVALKIVDELAATTLAGEGDTELMQELNGERLVVVLRIDGEHPAKELTSLEPLYVSPDADKGLRDFQLLFPPSDEPQLTSPEHDETQSIEGENY